MKCNLSIAFASGLLIFFSVACAVGEADRHLEKLRDEVRTDLTGSLLPFWMEKVTDTVNGGFHGKVGVDDKVYPEAERGGVVNSRILWTFSAAYRVLKDPEYLATASRAKDYIEKHFLDRDYGGAYRSVPYRGMPADARKQVYIQSFFLYAFSEYFRAAGDSSALDQAIGIYDLIEKYAFDRDHNGYFELFTRDWIRSRERLIGEKSLKEEKTMNTHLHLLESYTNLYRVWPDSALREKVINLVNIFAGHIIDNERYHLISFMERDWKRVSNTDSYGHDIEASWLLCEATDIIGDKALEERIRGISIKMADAAAEGLWPDGSLATEKDLLTGHKGTRRSWWEQAETVVGFLNAYQLTGNAKYLDHSLKCWEYIKKNMIDHENGGWYSTVSESGMPGESDKAGFWICPYHNGRMALEVMERVTSLKIRNK